MLTKKFKVLDLFAGAGGFSLGFKKFSTNDFIPFEIVGAVEIDKYAVNTLISALIRQGLSKEDAERMVICEDITNSETKKKLYETCPSVDIIIGGPPCQSFSTIGPRSGSKDKQEKFLNDDRDSLFEHYLEIVDYYKPMFFVFENVTGIISKKNPDGRKYIDIITERFENLGYTLESENSNVTEKYLILNAADFGVPQLRKRVFIIGNRWGIKNPYPKRTHCPPELVNTLELMPYVTLKDAIGDLPKIRPKITPTPPQKGISKKDMPPEWIKSIERKNRYRKNGVDPSPYRWDLFEKNYREGDNSRKRYLEFIKPQNTDCLLTGHVARGQQESDIILFRHMKQGMSSKQLYKSEKQKYKELAALIKYKMDSFEDKYKKLSWNKPCNTVFAHIQKDGNRFIHPDGKQERTITVRETARVQSFPDDYIFEAPGNTRYKYIGNAVPPILAMAIAEAIYRFIQSNQVKLYKFEIYKPDKYSVREDNSNFEIYIPRKYAVSNI